jgi:hypothetical protein
MEYESRCASPASVVHHVTPLFTTSFRHVFSRSHAERGNEKKTAPPWKAALTKPIVMLMTMGVCRKVDAQCQAICAQTFKTQKRLCRAP